MCIQTKSAMRLHKIIYYIQYAKIIYKVYIFLRYTIKINYIGTDPLWPMFILGTTNNYWYSIFHYNY
jgi:hypothetical protein